MIVSASNNQTVVLAAGEVLTVVASAAGSGSIVMLSESVGEESQGVTPIAAGETKTFGRYAATARFDLVCDKGYLTYGSAVPPPATQADLGKLSNIGSTAAEIDSASDSSDPVLFANLPAAPTEGMRRPVTDSSTATWGETITGNGANHVLAYYDGTNWTVCAK